MPIMPRFWMALRSRLAMLLWRGFNGFLLLATITCYLILCAAISKTIASPSSTTASSTPLARAFTLLLLRSAFFFGRAFSRFLLHVIFFVADRDRRHYFLRLKRSVLYLRTAHFNDR